MIYLKHESEIAVKSFPKNTSVHAELLFKTIFKEACSDYQICSVMADTNTLNIGEKTGVNKRLVDRFNSAIGHNIHTLECSMPTRFILITWLLLLKE